MTIFKCKMCGGTIEFEPGATVGVCDSCGTKQTLPRLDDDRKANLYDRANHFRRNNDFDKAMGIYEQILNEDSTDAEAYWSLVLCRYGIEYVEDPGTHKRIPTVNRAQFTSIFDDDNFKSALRYADAAQREVYEAEAKAINEIQKGILAISQKEQPFDVFICYKETDNNGRRTPDSVLANDLYHQLTQEGFKVFFARITLEDKLGSAYEPYIFAALNSAKVMVVLGTKPEYFNAVWVKNEWSRYLALVKTSGGKKLLIPAYKDMDPYDLPEEFSHLQAQDMGKLGFMQDLIRGIKKIISADAPKAAEKETVVVSGGNAAVEPLLKRAFMFLEDGNWKEADEYCEKVLDLDPENAQAYVGKLMAELQVYTEADLANADDSFDGNSNYQKAMRFGDEALRQRLTDYLEHTIIHNEQKRMNSIYIRAKKNMEIVGNEADYLTCAETFESISDYQDSAELALKCRELAEAARQTAILCQAKALMCGSNISTYEKAIQLLETIPGWQNADELRVRALDAIENIKKAELEQEKAELEQVRKDKQAMRIFLIVVACICVVVALLTTVIIPKLRLKKAMRMLDSGDYDSAYALLEKIGNSEAIAKYKQILLSKANVGDKVLFGTYEQYNITFGREAIAWQVLAKDENKILVISTCALDCQQYSPSYPSVTWESCSLRKWMNDTFLNAAFTEEEQAQILDSKVSADKNPEYSTDPDSATTDKVFLLSINEVEKYFSSDSARQCEPTDYTVANGAYGYSHSGNCQWWLRSPGNQNNDNAAYVNYDGSVRYAGVRVSSNNVCVRPAMWINVGD